MTKKNGSGAPVPSAPPQAVSPESTEHVGLFGQVRSFPRPFWMVNMIEMFERAAYYGVRVVIPIYIAQADEPGGLHFSQVDKGLIFSIWAIIQTLVPMFSGGFADRYGYKRTIAASQALTIIGYILMGTQRTFPGFLMGACVLAFGTAIFKPGVQGTLVRTLTNKTSSVGWGTFYMVVNIGGFLGPPIAHYFRGIGWPAVFFGCAAILSLNFLMLFTYKEIPSGGNMRGTPWSIFKMTCLNIEKTWWHYIAAIGLVGVGILLYFLAGPIFLVISIICAAIALLHGATRVGWFIFVMSGFWLMFMQLFDMLPNFIVDWVDTRALVQQFGLPGWMTDETARGTMIAQEWMINFNSGLIVVCVMFVSYLVAKMRRLSSIVIGMVISSIGLVLAGFTMAGALCILGILCFSVGEMLSSPKMNEYLGVIAPEGQKALYMGYANIPLAIGWGYGSLMGGKIYDQAGDKANLALRYLRDHFGLDPGAAKDVIFLKLQDAGLDPTLIGRALADGYVEAEGIARTHAFSFLQTVTAMDANQVTQLLWNTYHPYTLWYPFAAIGILSAIGIAIYAQFAKRWQAKDI